MMKKLIKNMEAWKDEMMVYIKHKTKKILFEFNRMRRKVPTYSIVFVLALVFTMAYSSYLIFAADADVVSVDGHSYTRCISSKYEYVSFGSFPQTKISDSDVTTLGLPTTPVSGKKYLGNDDNWYLYENDLQATPTGYWYRFEPIIWKIIDVDKTKGEEKLVLFSDKIIDSRSFDIFSDKTFGWDGYTTSNAPALSQNGLLAYPAVRLYLNSYDSTLDHYSSTTANPNYTTSDYSYSFLKYTEHPDREFYEQGFLEKAFSSSERNLILADINKTLSTNSSYYDGKAERIVNRNGDNYGRYDKVRLLSYDDAQDSTYGLFQIVNRAANLTDYSKTQLNQTSNNYSWLTMSRNSYTKAKTVLTTNYLNDVLYQNNDGIRPVITLDLANAPYLSGDGTITNPYTFGPKPMSEKVDASMFTTYYKSAGVYSPNDHGYVEYGSFPKDEITSENNSLIYDYLDGLKQDGSLLDGKTVQYQGEKYLREDYYHYSSEAGSWVTDTHYFKFAPIKWQVLKVDSSSNQIELLSESILESRNYDTMYNEGTLWHGKTYNSKVNTGSNGKQAYPSIRLYLNNYDSSVSTYNFDTNGPGGGQYSGSALEYTEYLDRTFYEQGFLGKAFTKEERDNIVPSKNDYIYSSLDGGETTDKVRLLSSYELFDSTSSPNNNGAGSSLGFGSGEMANGLDTNRIGFETDYSALRADNAPVTDSTTGRKSNVWFTRSNYSAGNAKAIHELGYVSSYGHNKFGGVRPVITLNLNGLVNNDPSRTGSINSPFSLGVKSFDTTVTLDDFTTWFNTPGKWSPSSSGYLYYGSFPKTKLTTTEVNTLGIASPEDGKVYEIEGDRYLYEINSQGTGCWYKFEPIKWQVLEVDKEKNHLVLMTEEVIEARSWDTINNTSNNVYWDGKNGSSGSGANYGKKSYPMLRLYLNSYDASQNYSAGTGTATYSALTYASQGDEAKFKDKGFFEKAFTVDERDSIVPDFNRFLYSNNDGTKANVVDKDKRPDKVRLLSSYETFDSTSPDNEQIWTKYGFHWDPNESGLNTNRIGFATDYSLSAKNFSLNSSYTDFATTGRKSIGWWTLSHSNNVNIQYITDTGSSTGVGTTADIFGIRPVITLDLTYLKKTSGNGSLEDPFMVETKVFDENVSLDDFERYYENPNKGYLYLGKFPKTKISDADAQALNLPSSPVEGKIYTSSVDGCDYLSETPINTSNTLVPSWYKVEPIKWEVLDIKKGPNDEDQLLLITESVIESRVYDQVYNSNQSKIFWDGSGTNAETLNGYSYQNILRLYLNSYDAYNSDGNVSNLTGTLNIKTYSSLTYKDWLASDPDIKFHNRGFLEKAFNENERAAIAPDITTLYNQFDGNLQNYKDSSGNYDKVRLLTKTEMDNNYGFVDNASRLGFGTDYGISNYSVGNLGNAVLDPAYVSRKTASWCGLTYDGTSVAMIYKDGSINSNNKNYYFGIRPVITLNIASLSKVAGKGSITDPYVFEVGPGELYKEQLATDGEINYFPEGYIDEDGEMHEGNVDVVSLSADSDLKVYCYDNGMAIFEGSDENGNVSLPDSKKTSVTKVAVSNNGLSPKSADSMLCGATNLVSVDLKKLDGTNLEDMSNMFDGCESLEEVTFPSNLNTTKVTDFEEMFKGCSSLETLDLGSFDIKTGAKTDDMFDGCTSLSKVLIPKVVEPDDVPLPSEEPWAVFDASNAKLNAVSALPGKDTYSDGSYIKTIDAIYTAPNGKKYYEGDELYAWDISSDKSGGVMAYYFNGDENKDGNATLREYDGEFVIITKTPGKKVVGFTDEVYYDGSKRVRNAGNSYYGEITSYVLDNNILHVTKGGVTYYYSPWCCLNARANEKNNGNIVKSFVVANDTEISSADYFFADLTDLEYLDISHLKDTDATGYYRMFYKVSLDTVIIPDGFGNKEAPLKNMFEYLTCDSLNMPSDFGSNSTDISDIFYILDCPELILPEDFGVKAIYADGVFDNSTISSLTLNDGFLSNAISIENLFLWCENLESITLNSDFGLNLLDLNSAFDCCINLKRINDPDPTDDEDWVVFPNGFGVTSEELANLRDTKSEIYNVPDRGYNEYEGMDVKALLECCESIQKVDLSNLSFDKLYDSDDFFYDCPRLDEVKLPLAVDAEHQIKLPQTGGSVWKGFLNGTDTGNVYQNLPAKVEGVVDTVKLVDLEITAGGRTFNPSDAIYKWNVAKDMSEPIWAYCFVNYNADGSIMRNSEGKELDTIVIFNTGDETNELMSFDSAANSVKDQREQGDLYTYKNFNNGKTYSKLQGAYVGLLSEERFRKTIETYNPDGNKITPWSCYQAGESSARISEFYFANKMTATDMTAFFAYLDDLEEINFDENLIFDWEDTNRLVMDSTFYGYTKPHTVKFENDIPIFSYSSMPSCVTLDFSDININMDYSKSHDSSMQIIDSHLDLAIDYGREHMDLSPGQIIKVPKSFIGTKDYERLLCFTCSDSSFAYFNLYEVYDDEDKLIGYSLKMPSQDETIKGSHPAWVKVMPNNILYYYELLSLADDIEDMIDNNFGLGSTDPVDVVNAAFNNYISKFTIYYGYNMLNVPGYEAYEFWLDDNMYPFEANLNVDELGLIGLIPSAHDMLITAVSQGNDGPTSKGQIILEFGDYPNYQTPGTPEYQHVVLTIEKMKELINSWNANVDKSLIPDLLDYITVNMQKEGYNGLDLNEPEDLTDPNNQITLIKKYYTEYFRNILDVQIADPSRAVDGVNKEIKVNYLDKITLEVRDYLGNLFDETKGAIINIVDETLSKVWNKDTKFVGKTAKVVPQVMLAAEYDDRTLALRDFTYEDKVLEYKEVGDYFLIHYKNKKEPSQVDDVDMYLYTIYDYPFVEHDAWYLSTHDVDRVVFSTYSIDPLGRQDSPDSDKTKIANLIFDDIDEDNIEDLVSSMNKVCMTGCLPSLHVDDDEVCEAYFAFKKEVPVKTKSVYATESPEFDIYAKMNSESNPEAPDLSEFDNFTTYYKDLWNPDAPVNSEVKIIETDNYYVFENPQVVNMFYASTLVRLDDYNDMRGGFNPYDPRWNTRTDIYYITNYQLIAPEDFSSYPPAITLLQREEGDRLELLRGLTLDDINTDEKIEALIKNNTLNKDNVLVNGMLSPEDGLNLMIPNLTIQMNPTSYSEYTDNNPHSYIVIPKEIGYGEEKEISKNRVTILMKETGEKIFTALNNIFERKPDKEKITGYDKLDKADIKVTVSKLDLGHDESSTYKGNNKISIWKSDDLPIKDTAYTKEEFEGYFEDGLIKLIYTNNVDEEIELTVNTDFEVEVVSSNGVGINTFKFKGLNNCEGYMPFEIKNTLDFSNTNKFEVVSSTLPEFTYTGSEITLDDLSPYLKLHDKTGDVDLVEGTHYTLTKDGDSKNAGTFKVIFTAKDGSGFEGETEFEITINPVVITSDTLASKITLDDPNVAFFKDGIRSKDEDKLEYAFSDNAHHVTPIFKLNDTEKIYLKYGTVLLCDNSDNPIFEAGYKSSDKGVVADNLLKRNVKLEGIDFDDSLNQTKGIKTSNYVFESELMKEDSVIIQGVCYLFDDTKPSAIKFGTNKTSVGSNKDIEFSIAFSEALDDSNFDTLKTDKSVYLTVNFGDSYSSNIYLDSSSLDTDEGENRSVLTFKGKTPTITESGEFKITNITLTGGTNLKDKAGNIFDTSSFKKSLWEDKVRDVALNTTGFSIGIEVLDHQQRTLTNKAETSDDIIYIIIDLSDVNLVGGLSDSDILSKFNLTITNNDDPSDVITKTLNDTAPFITYEKVSDDKYKFKLDFSDMDGNSTSIIGKNDDKGYKVKVELEKDVFESDDDLKNIKQSFEFDLKKVMEEGSLTIKLQREGEPDKELIWNKQKDRFEDNKGNEVMFQDGDKIVIEGPAGSKISYKENGDLKETDENKLEIPINIEGPELSIEEIGCFKEGYAINPKDEVKIKVNFVKLIIIKDGDSNGGDASPLGTFDITFTEKEISVTVNADYKAEIYEGSKLVKTLTETGTYLVENLKKLYNTLTVKVKFVSTKRPSGGGGGGGGGGSTPKPVEPPVEPPVIITEPGELHKPFMNGYEDGTFRPNNFVTREEVATIVARNTEGFNEEDSYKNFNSFPDATRAWSQNYIGFCKLHEFLHGYEDGSFHPFSDMTRAELATLVCNIIRSEKRDTSKFEKSDVSFSDVSGEWFEDDVKYLASLGILNGYEDGTFRGRNPVTRVEVAIVMSRLNHRMPEGDIPEEYANKVTAKFSDIKKGSWLFSYVAECAVEHTSDLY